MKVRISTLPAEGVTLKESLSIEDLNARMAEGRDNDIIFTSEPHAQVSVVKTVSGAETTGSVKATCTQPCSRCATSVERAIEAETNFTLMHIPEDADPDAPYEDDVGLSYYEGDHVELDNLVQEALILKLSRYWHPPENEDGCCSHCGVDFSEYEKDTKPAPKTQLGSLLKKAGVKIN